MHGVSHHSNFCLMYTDIEKNGNQKLLADSLPKVSGWKEWGISAWNAVAVNLKETFYMSQSKQMIININFQAIFTGREMVGSFKS